MCVCVYIYISSPLFLHSYSALDTKLIICMKIFGFCLWVLYPFIFGPKFLWCRLIGHDFCCPPGLYFGFYFLFYAMLFSFQFWLVLSCSAFRALRSCDAILWSFHLLPRCMLDVQNVQTFLYMHGVFNKLLTPTAPAQIHQKNKTKTKKIPSGFLTCVFLLLVYIRAIRRNNIANIYQGIMNF